MSLPARLSPEVLRSRFRGCLLGQAVGDAVGFQVETYSHDLCRKYAETWYDSGVADIEPRQNFAFGQYSDDTQLARELCLSLLERKGWDPDSYAGRISQMVLRQELVGGNKTIRMAVGRMLDGVAWSEIGHPTSVSNGAAMRAAPVGLVFFDDIETLVRVAVEQARITHSHPLAIAGSVMVATGVASALQCTSPLVPRDFLTGIELAVSLGPKGAGDLLLEVFFQTLVEAQEATTRQALDLISGLTINPEPDKWDRISPHVLPTVGWAIHCFLRYPDDYRKAVGLAVSAGGDTDTVAAITGALSGAYLGQSGLTEFDIGRITDRGNWQAPGLRDLADRLCDWTLARAG